MSINSSRISVYDVFVSDICFPLPLCCKKTRFFAEGRAFLPWRVCFSLVWWYGRVLQMGGAQLILLFQHSQYIESMPRCRMGMHNMMTCFLGPDTMKQIGHLSRSMCQLPTSPNISMEPTVIHASQEAYLMHISLGAKQGELHINTQACLRMDISKEYIINLHQLHQMDPVWSLPV